MLADPGAYFCVRCGALLPEPIPDNLKDRNHLFSAAGSPGKLLAWTAGGGGAFVVAQDGSSTRLCRLDHQLKIGSVGEVPDIAELMIVPPLGTRKGVFLVYEDSVWSWRGDRLRDWPAPKGSRLTGAATNDIGQLWVTAVYEDGCVCLLPLGPNGWRHDLSTEIPGFEGDPSRFLTLAVRRRSALLVEALIWGDGRAATVVDHAVPVHHRRQDAPSSDARLFQRLREPSPVIAQTLWGPGGARIVPAHSPGGRGVRVVRVVDGALKVLDPLPHQDSQSAYDQESPEKSPLLAAALTGSNVLFCRTKQGLSVFTDLEKRISQPLPDVDGCEKVSSAVVSDEFVVFQEHSLGLRAAWHLGSAEATGSVVIPPFAEASDMQGAPLLPLMQRNNAFWTAAKSEKACAIRIQSAPEFADCIRSILKGGRNAS